MAGEIAFRIDEADHLAGVRAVTARQLRSRRVLLRLTTLCIVAAALVGGSMLALGEGPLAALTSAAVSVIGGLAALAFCLGLTWLLLPRRAGRLYRQNRLLQNEVTARWSAAGVEWESRSGASRLGWSDIHAWQATPRVTIIHLTDLLFHMIPAHALDDNAQQDLIATLSRHAPRRR